MSAARALAKRNRDELEFLPGALEVLETPPRPAARMTAMTICAFVVATLVWATRAKRIVTGPIDAISPSACDSALDDSSESSLALVWTAS